ncbi:MAG: hypothetical protein SNJ69_15815, partial [Chloroflexaceae bacterium]
MNEPSPSPNPTSQRRRRDGLTGLVLLALLLALLPIGCIAEVALRLILPDHDPFKDVGATSGFGFYRPFPPGISFAAVDPALGDLQATEVARRAQTPVGVSAAVTVAPLVEVAPPLASIVPPTPTPTVLPTPRPTVTSQPATAIAGGTQPSPTPSIIVIIPGVTATPDAGTLPVITPTSTPGSDRIASPSPTLQVVTGPPTASATPVPVAPTPTATLPPVTTPLVPTATSAPAATPTAATPPTRTSTPRPTTPTPSATAILAPTPTEVSPTSTLTPVPRTATSVPTATSASVRVAIRSQTGISVNKASAAPVTA